MNIRFGAKYAPFIRTPSAENRMRKFNHLPLYVGGEMGRVYGKKHQNVVFNGR
jgi:hypothetical protein